MKRHVKGIRIGLLVSVISALLSGCSVIETVSDGLHSTLDGVSKVASSTTPDEKSAAFVETRFASIRSEAARGEGEHLDSLAKLLGETDRADFARFMKERYADLFSGLERPRELLARIDRYRGRRADTSTDA
jgi:nucleoid-associated protein YejK